MDKLGPLAKTVRDYLYEHRGESLTVAEVHAALASVRGRDTSLGAVRKALNAVVAADARLAIDEKTRPVTYRWSGIAVPDGYRPTYRLMAAATPTAATTVPKGPDPAMALPTPAAPQSRTFRPLGTTTQAKPETPPEEYLLQILRDKIGEVETQAKNPPAPLPSLVPPKPERPAGIKRPNGQVYRPRKLGALTDVEALRQLRGAKPAPIFALLAGPPGTGKTALVEAAFGKDLYVVTGNENTGVDDFLGQWSPSGVPGEWAWNDGPMTLAAKAGGVLFIDDATLIDPKVLAVVYPLMDGRGEFTTGHIVNGKLEVVKARPHTYVVAAHNPGVHGAVLTDALASRFTVQIWVESDLDLASSLGVPEKMIKLTRQLAGERERNDTGQWVPQLREMLAFRDIAALWGEERAAANLIGVAPEGPDRDVIAERVKLVFGKDIARLKLGGQA